MTLSLDRAYLYAGIFIFFLAGLSYTPYVPYWTSNMIFFLVLAPIALFNWKLDRFFVVLALLWLIAGLVPFFYTPVQIPELGLRTLKLMAPVFAYLVGKRSGIGHGFLMKLLIWALLVNTALAAVQMFVLPHAVLMAGPGGAVKWVQADFGIPVFAYRVTGLLGNPNALGAFTALVAAFVLGSREVKAKWRLIMLCLVVAFFFAKSRNSTLIITLMIFLSPFLNDRRRHLVLCLTLLGFLAAVLAVVDLDLLKLYFLRADVVGENIQRRLTINHDGLNIWLKYAMLFGGGFGSETYYMLLGRGAHSYTECAFVKLLLERGITGFLMHCSVLAYAYFKAGDRDLRDSMKYVLIAIGGVSLFETVFYVKELYILTFFCLGCVVGISEKMRADGPDHG